MCTDIKARMMAAAVERELALQHGEWMARLGPSERQPVTEFAWFIDRLASAGERLRAAAVQSLRIVSVPMRHNDERRRDR